MNTWGVGAAIVAVALVATGVTATRAAPAAPVAPVAAGHAAAAAVVVAPKPVVRRPLHYYFDGTRRLLPGHRLVAFYGAAGARGLGVLGRASPARLWSRLAQVAAHYQRPHGPRVVPTYELITYLATSSPGANGDYSSRISNTVIRRYVRVVHRHHGLLILDLQPGRGSFLTQAKSLRRWLRLPFVQLALDPEWKLYGNQLPLSRIGHTTAGAVNRVSRWLDSLASRYRLPQKLLLVHEFTDAMVVGDGRIVDRDRVAVVWNIDGFGSRTAKISRYRAFAASTQSPLGFKLFYDLDVDMMSPTDVLRLQPRAAVVEYE
jgi:hypothetical protein